MAESLSIHRLSVAQNSHYNFLAKATLGMFYKATDKPLEALELLRDVADNTGELSVTVIEHLDHFAG